MRSRRNAKSSGVGAVDPGELRGSDFGLRNVAGGVDVAERLARRDLVEALLGIVQLVRVPAASPDM